MEIRLRPIKQIEISKLKLNPLNKKFFKSDLGGETDQLYNDIKERGILVPLIAKTDGTLLAGHRRFMIARELDFETVPVQFIENELTEENEKQFIVKDNVLRRHLSIEERKSFYRFLIPNFDEKVMVKNSKKMGVNYNELADLTGINPKTVQYDITHMRQKNEKERIKSIEVDPPNEKEVEIFKRAMARMLNVAILGSKSTYVEFEKIIESGIERFKSAKRN